MPRSPGWLEDRPPPSVFMAGLRGSSKPRCPWLTYAPPSPFLQSRHPAFAELGPYALAYVDLDEGFRIMTNIVGVSNPVTDIQPGMRVKVRWEDQGEGQVSLPMFEPA